MASGTTFSTMSGGPVAKDEESSDEEPEQKQLKIIVLGDGAVGKTSMIQRYFVFIHRSFRDFV